MTVTVSPLSEWPTVALLNAKDLPTEGGVYAVLDANGEPIYIGRAVDLNSRWARGHHRALDAVAAGGQTIAWLATEEQSAAVLEAGLIAAHKPPLNAEIARQEAKAQEKTARLEVRKARALERDKARLEAEKQAAAERASVRAILAHTRQTEAMSNRIYAQHDSRVVAGNRHQGAGGKFLKTGGEQRARFTTTLPPSALRALDVLVTAAEVDTGVELQRNEALMILLGAVADDRFRHPEALRRFLDLAATWEGWGKGLQEPKGQPKQKGRRTPNKLGPEHLERIQKHLDMGDGAPTGWRAHLARDFGVTPGAITRAVQRLQKDV